MSGLGDVQFWLRARCSPAPHAVLPVKRLWDDYKGWCLACGHDVAFRRNFVRELAKAGAVVEFTDERTGEPRPFIRHGQAMVGRVQFKHDPVPVPVPREPWARKGPSGPTGPKRRARWRGEGSVEDAARVDEWMEDNTEQHVWAETSIGELYADYLLWADGVDGGEPWHLRGFAIQVRAAGFKSRIVAGQVRMMGLVLRPGRKTELREPTNGK